MNHSDDMAHDDNTNDSDDAPYPIYKRPKYDKEPRGPAIPSQRTPDAPNAPNSEDTPEATRQISWEDHTEHLRLSDEDSDELLEQNGFTLPPMMHHESVVEMLLNVDDDVPGPNMTALSSPDDIQKEKSKYDYSDDVHQAPIPIKHHGSAIGMRMTAFTFHEGIPLKSDWSYYM